MIKGSKATEKLVVFLTRLYTQQSAAFPSPPQGEPSAGVTAQKTYGSATISSVQTPSPTQMKGS